MTDHRQCTTCGDTKALEDFSRTRGDYRMHTCKVCKAAKQRDYYRTLSIEQLRRRDTYLRAYHRKRQEKKRKDIKNLIEG